MERASRGDHLLLLTQFDRVKLWHQDNLGRSELTAGENLRRLGRICGILKLNPLELAELSRKDPDRLQELLIHYRDGLLQRGATAAYVARTLVGLRNWLRFQHSSFDLMPKLDVIQGATIIHERVPRAEQLAKILRLAGTARGRVTILMLAHSGVRPQVLGNHKGRDGLKLRDLPDLKLKPSPSFTRKPFRVTVRASLSKNRRSYTTYGSSEAADAIEFYLEERLRKYGEKLTPDSPLISVGRKVRMKGKSHGGAAATETTYEPRFISTSKLTREVRQALRAAYVGELAPRPYILRAYCSTNLARAAAKGFTSSEMKEAWLGHTTSTNLRYNFGKELDEEVIDEMRESYARCEPFLASKPAPALMSRDEALSLLRQLDERAAELRRLTENPVSRRERNAAARSVS
jgi:hypothetical protein